MQYFKVIVAVLALGLSGCFKSQEPLNPPVLVTARDTDIAIQLFMQATILLSRYYGFDSLAYEELRDRSVRHGYSVLPFMPPVANRAMPGFNRDTLPSKSAFDITLTGKPFRDWADSIGGQRTLVTYYVSTGWRAAQLICRNYLVGLEEKNEYLEFLQKEFNIGAGLANAFLILSNANVTAMSVLNGLHVGGNLTIDEYQNYRFLTVVDRDAARVLVESAQNLYGTTFLNSQLVSGIPISRSNKKSPDFFPSDLSYFSEAVATVNMIEYQCTRSGIRGLLNKAARNTNGGTMTIDPLSRAIVFDVSTPPREPNPPPAPQKKK